MDTVFSRLCAASLNCMAIWLKFLAELIWLTMALLSSPVAADVCCVVADMLSTAISVFSLFFCMVSIPRAEHDVGIAALAITLERVARDARSEEEQVVEVGYRSLGAEAANVVDALARGPLDLRDGEPVVERGLAQPPLRDLFNAVRNWLIAARTSSTG